MKAVVVSGFGGPEKLRLAEAADPVPTSGQVRVAVHAAGVNPVDAGNRADGRWAGLTVPFIPAELAGPVERLSAVVLDHLAHEEREVVPLIEQHLTRGQWRATHAPTRQSVTCPPITGVLWLSTAEAITERGQPVGCRRACNRLIEQAPRGAAGRLAGAPICASCGAASLAAMGACRLPPCGPRRHVS